MKKRTRTVYDFLSAFDAMGLKVIVWGSADEDEPLWTGSCEDIPYWLADMKLDYTDKYEKPIIYVDRISETDKRRGMIISVIDD